jgi:putative inorganic carbon (hco3(-)) transporter
MHPIVKKFLSVQILFFLAAGATLGFLIIILSNVPGRYAPLGFASIAFPFIAMMFPNLRHFLLAGVVLSIPILLDINFRHIFENQAGAATMGIALRDIFVILLLIWWIVESFAAKRGYFRFSRSITLPALAYLEMCVLTLLWAPRTDLAMLEIVHMAKILLMYFVVTNQLREESDLKVVLWALVLTVLVEGGLGLAQFISGRSLSLDLLGEMQVRTGEFGRLERVGGTLGHPNRLALYLELSLPSCIAAMMLAKKSTSKWLAAAIFAIGFGAMIITGSRGGWIGVVFSLFVLFYLLVRNHHVSVWTVFKLGLLLCLIFAAAVLTFYDQIENRITGNDYGSAISRIPMFQMAWSIIKDHPIGGVGINNYAVNMRQYNDTLIGRRFKTIARPVHNMYLLITGETGLLGLSAFLWLLWATMRNLVRMVRAHSAVFSIMSAGLLSGISAYLVHGLVDKHPPGGNALFYLFLAMTAAMMNLPQEDKAC